MKPAGSRNEAWWGRSGAAGSLRTSSGVTRHHRAHRRDDPVPVGAKEKNPAQNRPGDDLEHVARRAGVDIRLGWALRNDQKEKHAAQKKKERGLEHDLFTP